VEGTPHPDPLHFVERANNRGGAGSISGVEIVEHGMAAELA
jgi:hypothetical protein